MPVDIRDIPVILSYDNIRNIQNKNKKRLAELKKLPNKKDISALSLIAKYLNNNY